MMKIVPSVKATATITLVLMLGLMLLASDDSPKFSRVYMLARNSQTSSHLSRFVSLATRSHNSLLIRSHNRSTTDASKESNTEIRSSRSLQVELPEGMKQHLGIEEFSHPQGRLKYSTHRCIGYHEWNAWTQRKCSFHNVCYNYKARGIHYYMEPSFTWPHVYPAGSGPQQLFFSPYVAYKSNAAAKAGANPEVSIWQENATMPDEGWKLAYVPGTSAIYYPVVDNFNLGHYVLDDVYSIFDLLQMFDQVSSHDDIHVVTGLPCSLVKDARSKVFCTRFAAFWRGVTKKPLLGFEEIKKLYGGEGDVICFEHLLVGTGNSGCIAGRHAESNRYNRAQSLWQFRNAILQSFDVSPFKVPEKHRILIFRKHGRRGLHNVDEIYEAIKSEERYRGLEVQILENVDDIPIQEQLELVTSSTLVITPPGGGSALFFFLPKGSHLIVADYWFIDRNFKTPNGIEERRSSQHMDDSLWDFVTHIKTLYYAVREGEYYVPPGMDPENIRVLRDECEIIVQTDRLFPIIDSALFDMSQPKGS